MKKRFENEALRTVTIAQLNAENREGFVALTGPVFEHSPWIAEAVWGRRPFADLEDLLVKMRAVIQASSSQAQVALIAAHPALAGRTAREGSLTAASQGEQCAAGLDRLEVSEQAAFDRQNSAYSERFGFPFVICAREHTPASILIELASRVRNERSVEISTALDEIMKIARLRLRQIVTND